MLKSKNIILYEIIGLLVLFTIVYFVVVTKVSYAFTYDASEQSYNQKIFLIEKAGKIYGESHLELFEKNDTAYVNVSELVEMGYFTADDEIGNVKNPLSDVKTLNSVKVRLSYQDGKVNTKVLS